MTREQLKSLSEDELILLWGLINIINPPLLRNLHLEPIEFLSINHKALVHRIKNCKSFIKDEHLPLFDGLVNKLGIS